MSTLKLEYIQPVNWWERAKWRLLEDYVSPTGYLIPAGYITDGISVPTGLRNIIHPTGREFPAAIVHDYVIEVENDWEKANEVFYNELLAIGTGAIRASIILSAVKVWYKYKTVKKKLENYK